MKWGKKTLVVLVILVLCFASFSSIFVGKINKTESIKAITNTVTYDSNLKWTGNAWGPISRNAIYKMANQMIGLSWIPVNTISNYSYGSNYYTYYANTLYTGIPYCQNNPQENWAEFYYDIKTTTGGTTYYGNDCSGFTSIAWRLPVRYTSTDFYNDAMASGGYVDKLNNMYTDLIRGDALVKSGVHILIFDYYDPNGLGIWSLEQYEPPGAGKYYNSFNALSGYTPIRRKLIDDSTPLFDFSVNPPSTCNLQSGGTVTVNVTINNISGPSDEKVTVFLNGLPSGVTPTHNATIGIPTPSNPMQATFNLTASNGVTLGSYSVNIIVTGGGETDQSKYFTLNITSPTNLPDLTVDDIWVEPDPPTAGGSNTVRFKIKNQGTGDATETFYSYLYFDDNYMGSGTTDGLAAGSDKTYYWDTTWPSDSNQHTVKVIVDATNIISESNESNNERSESFSATSSPNQAPILSSGSVSPASGTTSTTFTYSVNYSDPDGDTPSTKYVYIDGNPYIMSFSSGSASNGTYTYRKTNLSAGSHNYYFKFNDGHSHEVTTTAYSGPIVTLPSSSDSIGVFRSSTATFYFRASNGTVSALHFGRSSDTPIIGDWDGDGTDDIGVFRSSTATFYFRASNGTVSALHFGRSSDTPIIGDWQ